MRLLEHRSAEGSWEGLGFGNRRRRFPADLSWFLQTRGCVKQKSLQRPPTIRFTDSVLRTGFLIIFLRFGGGGGGGGDFSISPNSKICPSNITNICWLSIFSLTDVQVDLFLNWYIVYTVFLQINCWKFGKANVFLDIDSWGPPILLSFFNISKKLSGMAEIPLKAIVMSQVKSLSYESWASRRICLSMIKTGCQIPRNSRRIHYALAAVDDNGEYHVDLIDRNVLL